MTSTPRTPEDSTYRAIDLHREGRFRLVATNARGGRLPIGQGDDGDPTFTPVELLLAGLAGCGAIDLEYVLGKRADLLGLSGGAEGHKIRDEQGNRMVDLQVTLAPVFAEGEDGDRARAALERTMRQIEERLCTVGRTVSVGDPVRYRAPGEQTGAQTEAGASAE